MTITIYHNPKCSTSRKALERIRTTGCEPTIIEYLKNPPSREVLKDLLTRANMSVSDIIRRKGPVYEALDIANATFNDEELLDLIEKHPILIERPIVATPQGVRLCRPIEKIEEILPQAA